MCKITFSWTLTGMPRKLFADQAALAAVCRRHHIRRLSLFGSTLKGLARSDSDVDLLVEFDPGKVPGLLQMAAIEMDLSSLLGGRRVDLRTARELSRYFRDEVVRTAEVQYAA
jgi:predicted nucleotidyltransferase